MKLYASLVVLCVSPWSAAGFSAPVPMPEQPRFTPPAKPWENFGPMTRVEGQTRRTWKFGDTSREVVQVKLETEGRPLGVVMELWVGPDWTPLTIKAASEDGTTRPVQTLIGTRNKVAQIEIRNRGPYELPLNAACAYAKPPLSEVRAEIPKMSDGRYVEGGSVYSVPFDGDVEQVQVLLNTESKQLNAKVELLNGPNNPKQEFEIFTNNGVLNALYVVFNTPGSGNVVRVTNIAPLEFPCKAYISAAEKKTFGSGPGIDEGIEPLGPGSWANNLYS